MTAAMTLTKHAAALVWGRDRARTDSAAIRAELVEREYPPAAPIPAFLRRRHEVEIATVKGRPVITFTPKDHPPATELIYLHGGAYVQPIGLPQWIIVGQMLRRLDAAVTVPLYGLAPWHTIDDALALLSEVHAMVRARASQAGVPLAIGGDSAGGGLTLAHSVSQRDAGADLPDRLLLICPWVDVTVTHPDVAALVRHDLTLNPAGLRVAGELWAGTRDVRDPVVSPIYADLAGLPPMRSVVGGQEILLPDARDFDRAARAAGVDASLRVYPAGFHEFPVATYTRESRSALTWLTEPF
ncbi:MAG: steryl acetyl hydrolase [Herbiconiux sp.]|uniref:alpha/beta hydrolase fold domain-containing protein n=1 Tax=Herbiconiux sp. TaxID=1871186 RepID=UPI0012173B72|nr:alpha/beta hydrolase fold domain-containing protein [Herbiconiux sp.]TAJ48029.1 MAG: steryl acetyl hydrolase [Herbiconiux sp.]